MLKVENIMTKLISFLGVILTLNATSVIAATFDVGTIERKQLPKQKFYTVKVKGQGEELTNNIKKNLMPLGKAVNKSGAKINGPAQLLFENEVAKSSEPEFLLALPISGNPRNKGRFRTVKEASFNCIELGFKGDSAELPAAWIALGEFAAANNLTLSGESRTVMLEDKSLRLQLGVL